MNKTFTSTPYEFISNWLLSSFLSFESLNWQLLVVIYNPECEALLEIEYSETKDKIYQSLDHNHFLQFDKKKSPRQIILPKLKFHLKCASLKEFHLLFFDNFSNSFFCLRKTNRIYSDATETKNWYSK